MFFFVYLNCLLSVRTHRYSEVIALWPGPKSITTQGMNCLLTPLVNDMIKAYAGDLFFFFVIVIITTSSKSSPTKLLLKMTGISDTYNCVTKSRMTWRAILLG